MFDNWFVENIALAETTKSRIGRVDSSTKTQFKTSNKLILLPSVPLIDFLLVTYNLEPLTH